MSVGIRSKEKRKTEMVNKNSTIFLVFVILLFLLSKEIPQIIEFVIELLDLVEGCGPPWAGAIPGCFNPPGPLHLPFPDLLGAMDLVSNLLVGVC